MATPPPQSRVILLVLGLLIGACSAGQYDVQECDPSAPNLQKDLCAPLNDAMGLSGCMLYHCDNVSRRCVLKPLDYDRDGDPDKACGGGDCDDTDPTVYSTAVEACDNKDNNCNGVKDEGCSCDPNLIGTPCFAGTGVCRSTGQWTCPSNVPSCNAVPGTRNPNSPWHPDVDPITKSADWNCDGKDDLACCVDSMCNQANSGCGPLNCSPADPNALCANFCHSYNLQPFACPGATTLARCDATCGGRTLVCHCTYIVISLSCEPSGSYFGPVGCR